MRLWAILFAVVASAVTLVLVFREEGDALTKETLAGARELWRASGPKSYDLEVALKGAQEGEHAIEVRDGEVIHMTTGGAPVRRGAWELWSVDGMFRFLRTELRNRENPRPVHGVSDPSDVTLRVVFDETYGYPRRFFRHVSGVRPRSIEWEVTSFIVR